MTNTVLAWADDFPKGYGHTSIAFLRRCRGFEDAKLGNLDAAQFVVSRCIKHDRISQLRKQYPDAVLLPVFGQNKLPFALALAIGLPIWRNVHLLHTVSRKSLSAFERLLHKPTFIGYIQIDLSYILVDDIITQGGTVAALREFVVSQGGKVVAVTSLAFAIGSHAIAPIRRHTVRLMVKFGASLFYLLEVCGVNTTVYELTNSQVKYLLRFSSIRNIEKRIDAISVN